MCIKLRINRRGSVTLINIEFEMRGVRCGKYETRHCGGRFVDAKFACMLKLEGGGGRRKRRRREEEEEGEDWVG